MTRSGGATLPKVEHRFSPKGACGDIFTCRDPEVLVAGPAGTGKSRACLEKLHLMCLLNPGMRGLICRKTATSLSSTALVTWRKFVVAEALNSGDVNYYGGSAQEPASYRYRNGSTVVIGGLDKIEKIMSSEYDLVYVQEATDLTENDWESITTRLRNWQVSFQQILGDCNPSHPTHWLKTRCDNGQTTMFQSTHEDNPILFADGAMTERGRAYLSKLDRLTGVRYQRLRLGNWVAAEGVIYEDFSDVHMLSGIPEEWRKGEALDHAGIPISWPRFWAVDFGFTNPFTCQWWAEDPDGRLYMYREIYYTRRTVDQHAKTIMAAVAPQGRWLEPKPHVVTCDHDAEGRVVFERETDLSTSPAHKAVTEGIQAVQVRLRDAGDGRRRLYLLRDALVEADPELVDSSKPTCLYEEIPGYVWDRKKNTRNPEEKDEPKKADDHGCDAMRYVVAERDFGIRAIFRSV
jgi:PBSX family phage terminase large subunit